MILIFAAYFVGLGALPFVGPDEPRYAQVAREMFERGDWLTPTLGGFEWFEKPALAYWLMIAGYKLFGVNEFAARAGSAAFGLLTILAVYLLVKFAGKPIADSETSANENQLQNNDLAFWTMLVAASSIGLLVFAHAATFDIVLTFPITAALCCFFIHENRENAPLTARRLPRTFLIGFYFFVGLALLAKGLIGAVLPFGIVFCYFAARRRFPGKMFLLSLIWGAILTLATAGIWYLPMYWRHGWTFVDEFFVQHHFARYTSNKYQHPEPFWFFWAILPALALPWTPFLIHAIWRFFKVQSPKSKVRSQSAAALTDLRVFASIWLFVPLVFFSFSGSKLPGYILPALPAAILLAGEQVWRFVGDNRKRRNAVMMLAAAILVAVPISLTVFAARFAQSDTTKYLVAAADAKGFDNVKVANLHDISHSLEFYAANRLVRTPDGRQRKFEGVFDIVEQMKQENARQILVLVPLEHEHQLAENGSITIERIGDNTAFALIAATRK